MFKISWEKVYDLSFNATKNVLNPLNENLPVKRSRDCQELAASTGEKLCSMIDEGASRKRPK